VKPNNNLSEKFRLLKKQGVLKLHPNRKGGNQALFVEFKNVYESNTTSKETQIQKMENIIKKFEARSDVSNKSNVLELPNKPNVSNKSNVLELPNKPNVSNKFEPVYNNKALGRPLRPWRSQPKMNKINQNPNEEKKAVNENTKKKFRRDNVKRQIERVKGLTKNDVDELMNKWNKSKNQSDIGVWEIINQASERVQRKENKDRKKAVGKIGTLASLKKTGANIRRINNLKKKLIGAKPIYNNSNSNTENNIKPKKTVINNEFKVINNPEFEKKPFNASEELNKQPNIKANTKKKGLLNNAIDKAMLKKKLTKLTPLGGRAAETPKPPNTPKPNKPSFRGLVQKNKEKRVMNAVKIASQKVAISQATGAERVKLSRKFAPKTQNNVNKLSGFGKLLTKNTIGNTRPRSERRVDNKERLKELKKVVKKKNPRLSPMKINMEARKMLKKEKGT
jgi:hypothetical protein